MAMKRLSVFEHMADGDIAKGLQAAAITKRHCHQPAAAAAEEESHMTVVHESSSSSSSTDGADINSMIDEDPVPVSVLPVLPPSAAAAMDEEEEVSTAMGVDGAIA